MEKFEKYRKDLAKELKETPKEERKAILKEKKDHFDYREAKKLHKEKIGSFKNLTQTEKLTDPNDIENVISWFDAEIDEFLDFRTEAYSGCLLNIYDWKDLFTEAARYLARRIGANVEIIDSLDLVSEKELSHSGPKEYYDEYASRTIKALYFLGREICKYDNWTNADGEGSSVGDWDKIVFEKQCGKLLEILKQSKQASSDN
jgi:hypothetical protein